MLARITRRPASSAHKGAIILYIIMGRGQFIGGAPLIGKMESLDGLMVYELLELIGRGNATEVFKAMHKETKQ